MMRQNTGKSVWPSYRMRDVMLCIARSKRNGTCAETRFGLSAKRTSPFKSAWRGGGGQFSQLLAVEECGSADSDCIDRVPTYSARLLATHSIRIFPLHFPSRASRCAVRFRTQYRMSGLRQVNLDRKKTLWYCVLISCWYVIAFYDDCVLRAVVREVTRTVELLLPGLIGTASRRIYRKSR